MDMIFVSPTYPYVVDQFPKCVSLPIEDDAAVNHQCLNLLNQGSGAFQRVGLKIAMKSIRLRFQVQTYLNPQDADIVPARMLLIYDKQPNGTYTPLDQILGLALRNNTEDATSLINNQYASLFPSKMERFIILMDKQVNLAPKVNTNVPVDPSTGEFHYSGGTGASTDRRDYVIDEYIKLNKLETVFNNTVAPQNANTISLIQTGALILYWTSSHIYGEEPAYRWEGVTRLRYYDA